MQPNKHIHFNDNARLQMQSGIDLVANAVKITLGPRGKNVAIQRILQAPLITNDGVSIANNIKVENQTVNMGVELAKEVARRTDRTAGDGTTTTLVLYQALVDHGLRMLPMISNVMKFKKGMDMAKDAIVAELRKRAVPISGLRDIRKVAFISVENEKLADMISNVLYTVGVDGNIIVEETEKPDIYVEMKHGYTVDRGYASPYVINNPGKMEGEYKNVRVLVTDRRLMASTDLVPLFQKMQADGNTNLLLIADDIDGEMLISSQITHNEGLFNVIPVRFACYSQDRHELLKDIAVRCGTQVYGQGKIKDLKDLELDDLGSAEKIVVKKDTTLVVVTQETEDYITHTDALKTQLQDEITDDTKKFLNYRISNLMGKTAVIKVGALTEQERKYYKLKIDDAVNATRGAMEEGIVEGGGFTLADIAKNIYWDKNEDIDIILGMRTVILSCLWPFWTILRNSGEQIRTRTWWQKLLGYETKAIGRYNASTGEYVDNLIEEGVVDPVKVTVNALINSVSGASVFLTTDVSVAFEKEYKPELQQQ